jgi:ATP-dependent DNA ligase
VIQEFKLESKSSDTKHTVKFDTETGQTSCSCMAWRIPKRDKPRDCKHAKMIREQQGADPTAEPLAPVVTTAPVVPDGYVVPMLAMAMPEGETVDTYAGNPAYGLQVKMDGHRVTVIVSTLADGEKAVQAFSRPKDSPRGLVRELPANILADFARFPDGTYDGELMIPGGKSYSVTDLGSTGKHIVAVFDVVRLLGRDITKEPYSLRHEYLGAMWESFGHELTAVALLSIQPVSMAAVQAIWDSGGEGAIIKRLAATYKPGGRTKDWIKVKRGETAEVVIIGFEAGKNSPYGRIQIKHLERGFEGTIKTPDMATLRRIEKDPDSFIGRHIIVGHEGVTKKKLRGPIVFDHFV